ncbi:MAG: VOC family protein [Chitinophagaceae bacterium]|nr:VOC family protein [Chitinophagaceae bacterium]
MANQIFVNLPVSDLRRSMDFFRHLGFSFNMQFTDEKAACLEIGPNNYAMLLVYERLADFTQKPISDAHESTEVLIAIDAESRQAVDDMIRKAIEGGGSIYADPQDHGWMYGHSFADPDGHQWEVIYMDEEALPKNDKS